MKVLVTGATGYIGGHVADACLARGWETRALVRPTTPAARLSERGVEVFPGDITDAESVASAVKGCDAVLHLAALYAFWAPEPDAFERANVDGSLNVVRAARDAGARLVYCSSLVAVGGSPTADGHVDETSSWDVGWLRDPYIVTKRRAEEAVLALAAEGDADVVVVNPCAPLGPSDWKPTPTGDILTKFLNGYLPFWVDGGVNVVDVRAVAQGHLLAFEKGRRGERYILGGQNVTYRELLGRFADATGLPRPRMKLPWAVTLASAYAMDSGARVLGRAPMATPATARASRVYWFGSIDKARRELGYEPGPIEPAMVDAARWFIEQGRVRPSRAARVLAHVGA